MTGDSPFRSVQGNDQADPGEIQQSMTAFPIGIGSSISTGRSTTAAIA
jgi:hypothetical protein